MNSADLDEADDAHAASSCKRPPPAGVVHCSSTVRKMMESDPRGESDVVLQKMWSFHAEFTDACRCLYERLHRPTTRGYYYVYCQKVTDLSDLATVFCAQYSDQPHANRYNALCQVLEWREGMPPDAFGQDCYQVINRYCTSAQFVVLFNVPERRPEYLAAGRRGRARRSQRRLEPLVVACPPLRHCWSLHRHAFLKQPLREAIDTLLKIQEHCPVLPQPVMYEVVAYMIEPQRGIGVCRESDCVCYACVGPAPSGSVGEEDIEAELQTVD